MNHCPEVRAALGRRQASYGPQRKVLTVIAMAKLSHESVFRLASLFYADMVDVGLLTRSERRLIQIIPESQMLAGAASEGTSRKTEARHGFPDACCVFEDRQAEKAIPTVIYEVAFTESYSLRT